MANTSPDAPADTPPGGPQRQTRQRAAVAQVLDSATVFRTAQQVYEDLRSAGASVGLTTVYRTLAGMAESGDVDVLRNANGELSYRRCSSDEHHHHLVCRGCGRAVEIESAHLESWAKTLAATYGFRDVGHDLELHGLCADC